MLYHEHVTLFIYYFIKTVFNYIFKSHDEYVS